MLNIECFIHFSCELGNKSEHKEKWSLVNGWTRVWHVFFTNKLQFVRVTCRIDRWKANGKKTTPPATHTFNLSQWTNSTENCVNRSSETVWNDGHSPLFVGAKPLKSTPGISAIIGLHRQKSNKAWNRAHTYFVRPMSCDSFNRIEPTIVKSTGVPRSEENKMLVQTFNAHWLCTITPLLWSQCFHPLSVSLSPGSSMFQWQRNFLPQFYVHTRPSN